MTATAKQYRIPCRCGGEVTVGPGQAGGHVECPWCGGSVTVPRLRELEAFVVTEAARLPRPWRPCQAWLLLGCVVALASATAAVLVPRISSRNVPPLPDETAIRAAVNSADTVTIYKAWQSMRTSGVDRGTLPQELRLQQAAGAAGRIGGVLWTLAAAGGVVAVAGGISCFFASRLLAVAVGIISLSAVALAEPPSPGQPPRFFGLEAVGERIAYVCDRSASMSEPDGLPLAEAKRELLASIESLGESRQFHLMFYNERQSMLTPPGGRGRPMFADESTLRDVRRFLEGTSAAGGTRHYEAVVATLRLAPDVVFLLTDAEEKHDLTAEELDRLTERLGTARCMVVQFGGGAGRRSPRLARLAAISGGDYRVVEPVGGD
jgi:hypothetical protein